MNATFNIQVFENEEWVLIFRSDFSDRKEVENLLKSCKEYDPNGTYKIVEHWN